MKKNLYWQGARISDVPPRADNATCVSRFENAHPKDTEDKLYSTFSQLGNSGNSAISVKGKGLTNVKIKIYVERNVFSKGKI